MLKVCLTDLQHITGINMLFVARDVHDARHV